MPLKNAHAGGAGRAEEKNPTGKSRYASDVQLAGQCLAGDDLAAMELLQQHNAYLKTALMKRGASESKAEDFLADLWGDCLGVKPDRSSLLSKYSGQSSLRTWLVRVATNRWIDRIRCCHEIESEESIRNGELLVSSQLPLSESLICQTLREALREAFENCDPEGLVMLQLVYVEDISQTDLAAAWGVSESKVSRRLAKTMKQISDATVAVMKQKDPHLQFEWEDFLEICATGGLAGIRHLPPKKAGKLPFSKSGPNEMVA